MFARFKHESIRVGILSLIVFAGPLATCQQTACSVEEANKMKREITDWGKCIVSNAMTATEEQCIRVGFERIFQSNETQLNLFLLEVLEACGNAKWAHSVKPLLDDKNSYVQLRTVICLASIKVGSRSNLEAIVLNSKIQDARDIYENHYGYGLYQLVFDLEKRYALLLLHPNSRSELEAFLNAAYGILYRGSLQRFPGSGLHEKIHTAGHSEPGYFDNDVIRAYELLAKSGSAEAFMVLLKSPTEGTLADGLKLDYAMCASVYLGNTWDQWNQLLLDAGLPIDPEFYRNQYYEMALQHKQTGKRIWPLADTSSRVLRD